ncbi:hypothetical protein M422DRAFT_99636, partial [Sphaerobolus stellatus SS14]
VSVATIKKYLSAVRAWHIVQGWPTPLSDQDQITIGFSLRGLENIQAGKRSRPPRPPIVPRMLSALKLSLHLNQPYGACVWAMSTCAFWGMMRSSECCVKSQNKFDGSRHLKRSDVHFGTDLDGKPYARLDLPSAKTAKPGKKQSVFLTKQGELCPLAALHNLFRVVPARASDPLFSWRDNQNKIRPLVKQSTIKFINDILSGLGWGTSFGHSFRIGGASYYLAQKVDPEIIRIAGRWRSLAYETYIRAF